MPDYIKSLKKEKKSLEGIKDRLIDMMDYWDTHAWDETKYLNADLNHLSMLLGYAIESIKCILEDHEDLLETEEKI